jgi:hypothetical protein
MSGNSVVDDGSRDDTRAAREHGAHWVERLPQHAGWRALGVGLDAALRAGATSL